jgi:hypothetical protein
MGQWAKLGRIAPARLAIVVIPMLAAGCMIPTYHQPQGFSSTYYRHLQHVAAVQQAEAASKGASSPSKGHSSIDDAAPKLAEADDTSAESSAESSGSWWSWIRRPLTFRSSTTEEDDPAQTRR